MAYTKYTPFANGDAGSLIREKLNALGESVNAIGDGTKPINYANEAGKATTRIAPKDFLNVDTTGNFGIDNMKPGVFGSETPTTDFINSPYTAGPFYGYREVFKSKHLITVQVTESYPIAGRVWTNTYDPNYPKWYGWKINGDSATPSDVKTAYDKAVEALNAVGTLKTQVQNGTVVAANAANATNATRATSAGYADSSGSCSGNAATASRVPVANVGNCRFIWDGTNLNITTG